MKENPLYTPLNIVVVVVVKFTFLFNRVLVVICELEKFTPNYNTPNILRGFYMKLTAMLM